MSDLTKILLVDDNPKYIEDVLPFYGYEVVSVYNGRQALEKLDSGETFDLMLLDVMMPDMNGWETLKAIRKSPSYKDIPIIMVTAVSEDQKMISGLKIGADDYIVKPFILPNLLARIEAVLRRAKRFEDKTLSHNVTNSQNNKEIFLTSREKDVLLLVTQGFNNQEIADKMSVTQHTVKSHMQSIFKKLNVKTRTQAVLVALQLNLNNENI